MESIGVLAEQRMKQVILNLVTNASEAHHGGLGLASEPGVGSCFRVFLPLGE